MKTTPSITVKRPCTEIFDNFKSTDNGGFCGNCQKEVIDFTSMSTHEIMKQLQKSSNTCGRFKKHQLNTPMAVHQFRPSWAGKAAVFAVSVLTLTGSSAISAQQSDSSNSSLLVTSIASPLVREDIVVKNYTVKGIVIDDQNLPLAGVNVVLKNSNVGIQTDFDGKFEFPKKLTEGDVLIFSYIGFETKEYVLEASESKVIDIKMQFDATDIILMGDVAVEGVYKSKKNIFQKFFGLFK